MGECLIVRRGGVSSKGVKFVTITSGDELPNNAKDGALAVVSTTGVGEIYITNNEPTEPAEGDVWVTVENFGDNVMTINGIQIYLDYARQYIGGEWVIVETYLRVNGAWSILMELVIDLVKLNTDCTAITGSWNSSGTGSYGGGRGSDGSVSVYTGPGSGNYSYAITSKQIDFTHYNTLQLTGGIGYTLYWFRVYVINSQGTTVAEANISNNGATIIDISALTGMYSIRLGCQSYPNATMQGTGRVNEMYISV